MPVTAIYVHVPNTTLTIDAGGAPLIAKAEAVTPTDNPVTLAEGVYLIASKKEIVVTGEGRGERYDVHEPRKQARAVPAGMGEAASKDDWPDPPKKFSARRDEIVEWLNAKGGDAF